jgi:excisionase family DNA binding protein
MQHGGKMEAKMTFLTVKEVAIMLRLSLPTIYRLLKKKNGIPVHRIGGSWRFIEKEVVRWAEERR